MSLAGAKVLMGWCKSSLAHNDFLTLDGITPETLEYRAGNHSALEWVIEQHRVNTFRGVRAIGTVFFGG